MTTDTADTTATDIARAYLENADLNLEDVAQQYGVSGEWVRKCAMRYAEEQGDPSLYTRRAHPPTKAEREREALRDRLIAADISCSICGQQIRDWTNARAVYRYLDGEVSNLTCEKEFCVEAWERLQYHLDPELWRTHRISAAKWRVAQAEEEGETPSEYDLKAAEGNIEPKRESLFRSGSKTLECAKEAVKRGYQPVIEGLSEDKLQQVYDELGAGAA